MGTKGLTTICVIKRDKDKIRSFVSDVNNAVCLNRKRVIPGQINQFFAKFARPPSDFDETWHT